MRTTIAAGASVTRRIVPGAEMIATLRVTSRAFAIGLALAGVPAAPGVHAPGHRLRHGPARDRERLPVSELCPKPQKATAQ